jgi:hypothetical protein
LRAKKSSRVHVAPSPDEVEERKIAAVRSLLMPEIIEEQNRSRRVGQPDRFMANRQGFIKDEVHEHGKSPESQRKAQEGRDLRNEGRVEDGKAPTTRPGPDHPEK